MISITPKTKLGKWSVGLIVAMPVLFIVGSLAVNWLYPNVEAPGTILQDLVARPLLAISMLTGIGLGIASFITGLIALLREKERGLLVFLAVAIGALLIFFLAGELISPH